MAQNLIENFLTQLNKTDVKYCFIRNFTKEELYLSPDIDILIDKSSYAKSKAILKKMGFVQIFSGPFPGHAVFLCDDPENSLFINIDLHIDGLIRDGLLYLPGKLMLDTRIKNSRFYIPSTESYILGLVMHCIIDKRKFKSKYQQIIYDSIKKETFNDQLFLARIIEVLPRSGRLLHKLILSGDFESLVRIRNRIILERYFLYPRGILNTCLIYLKRFVKVVNPFWLGKLYVFLGPEGSGKSTTSQTLTETLRKSAIRSKKIYMGWHEIILPFYAVLKRVDNSAFNKTSYKKNNQNSENAFREHIIFFIYFLELHLRYWMKIYPARKIGIIVVTDRYFYDGIFLYNKVPQFLKSIMQVFIPKPTMCFMLNADVNKLSIRKKEVPQGTLIVQHRAYEEGYKKIRSKKTLIKTNSVKSISSQIHKHIIKSY